MPGTDAQVDSALPLPANEDLENARRFQTNGDYALAIETYQKLLNGDPASENERAARYHLAESYLLNREYLAAATAWEEFLADYPDDERAAQATLMLARALVSVNDCAAAIPYYHEYLAGKEVLADTVSTWLGDCYAVEDKLEEAIAAYRHAVESASDQGVEVSVREKIAGIYSSQEDYSAAIQEYDVILDVAKTDYYRARIEYLAGQALMAAGETDAAYERYRRALDSSSEAEFAYFALIQLVEADLDVDEFQRGLVDYYAGAKYPEAYDAAIRAFDRYLASEPEEKADEALYRKSQAQRAIEEPDAALATLEVLIEDYPESTRHTRAWLDKGYLLAQMGASVEAIKVYQDLAAFFPADELAPTALWRSARLREADAIYSEAAVLFEQVQEEFPAFDYADSALWRAGLSHYRSGDEGSAVKNWKTLVEKYPESTYQVKALYWLGKVGAVGEDQEGEDYWDQLVAENPQKYYALRVQQIRAGESLTATRLITDAVEPPTWDAEEFEDEILEWLRGWTDVPTGTELATLPENLSTQEDLKRGETLLAIGLRREALDTLDKVRAAAWKDPVALAQLAFYFRDKDWAGLAARSAVRLAGLWPDGSIADAPLALKYLAYPLPYSDLLSAEAQAKDVDPLLLAALVRQESLFEPVAESYAGARGLGQVMPATGKGIAKSLGMEDFVLDDLYRPYVSVKFGAFYVAVQMNRFDDEILLALAAYNGGPGNTLRWLEAGGDDLDLFVEVITAEQSRLYLQKVYEQYLIYESLYRSSEDKEP